MGNQHRTNPVIFMLCVQLTFQTGRVERPRNLKLQQCMTKNDYGSCSASRHGHPISLPGSHLKQSPPKFSRSTPTPAYACTAL